MDISKPLLIVQLSTIWALTPNKGGDEERLAFVKQHEQQVYELGGGKYDDKIATDYLNDLRRSFSLRTK